MGRPEEPLVRDGSLVREFAFWLRDLRNRSGLTYQQLARAANYATSTMQAAAGGRSLPTLKVTTAFVNACAGDEAAWQRYWRQVKRALDADSPPDLIFPIRPPWAATVDAADPAPAGAGAGGGSAGNGARSPARSPAVAGAGPGAGTQAARPAPRSQPGPEPGPPAGAPGAGGGWYVESFRALLRMDAPEPEAVETRVIVALEDGLRELDTSISVPRVPDDGSAGHELEAELLFGGSLELREQPFESYFRHVIALAAPLHAGQRHEYQLRLRVPPGQPMAPHYVYVPFHRCDYFQLRIRFPAGRLPRSIRALAGTPPAVIYERGPDGAALAPDRFGEVSVEFRELRLGHAYGIRWAE
jgi:hypothetical protein